MKTQNRTFDTAPNVTPPRVDAANTETHTQQHTQKQERGPHRTHSFSVLVRGTTKLGNREGVTSPLADSDPWSGGGEDSDPSAAIKTRTLGFKGGSQVCFFLKNKKTKKQKQKH